MYSRYRKIDLGGGKTQRIYLSGIKEHYLNGKLHKIDGPAIEYPNGDKVWCINEKIHREDGPAIEFSDGHKVWHIDGKIHRKDGPAVIYSNGNKEWFINGKECDEKVINFIIKRERDITIKYWLKWTDYVMNPNTERGKRHANRLFDKLVSMAG